LTNPNPTSPEDLKHRFDYHPPRNQEVVEKHQDVRNHCHTLAQVLLDLIPDSREKSLAITKVEEVMMWANAAIARYFASKEE
jgi:hypothetical protein